MVADGHEVVFLTTSAYLRRQANPPMLRSGWTELDEEGVSLHVLKSSYGNELGFLARVSNFISFAWRSCWKGLRVGDFDLIYATSTPLTVGIPAMFLSLVKQKPYYFEVRDLWPELPIAVGAIKSPILIWVTQALEDLVYRRASKIVALSPGMRDGIIKTGVAETKVSVVPNSSDIDLFSVSNKETISYSNDQLGFLNGRKLVVYTGTVGEINDLFFLVDLVEEVVALTDQICFLVVGEGKERPAVMQYAVERCVMDSALRFWDGLPKSEVRKLLSCADMALSLFADKPEMEANSANKFFDALASGTPVSINYGGWQKDILESTHCGIFLDRSQMAQSAQRLVSTLLDDSVLAAQAAAAYDLACRKFSRDHVYDDFRRAVLPKSEHYSP